MSLFVTTKDKVYTGITVIIVAVVVLLAVLVATGGGSSHTLYAQFSDAQFLVKGNTVHVNGVTVGKVENLKVDAKDNTAIVKMSIDKSAWPVYTNATATVRPVTLLGEEYIDLDPGSVGHSTFQNNGMIKVADTTSSTNLQSVLDAVTDPTATALGTFISSLGEGMANQGINANDAIKALAPALTNTSGLVKLLNGQNSLLNSMIDNVTPTLQSLDTNQGKTLDGLLTTTNNLLTATAASSQNIGTDLQELPGTLHAATNTFNQLGNLATQATPALASITPLTNNLQTVSQELLNFSNAANPAVSSLQPLLTQAQGLVNKAAPVVSTLKTIGPQSVTDATNLKKILQPNVADLNNFFSFISEWASTTGDFDGTSHYFRFHAQGDTCVVPIVTGSVPGCQPPKQTQSGNNVAQNGPSTNAKPAAAKPAAKPAAQNPLAGVGGTVNNLLQQPGQIVNNLLGGLLGQKQTPSAGTGSATGLTQNQEQNLLGYLLGGL